ncbi:hypothetical protein, partial [Aeromonas sp. QDB51]|uniref:hypothetical protein n=1 Tax=Aeromonas sp. QDB51 TaxID=2989827 RepID=UPI0022E1E075
VLNIAPRLPLKLRGAKCLDLQGANLRIKMFNAIHHPGERITGKSLALSFKSKLRSNERTQGGVYLNRNREYLREEGRFADK